MTRKIIVGVFLQELDAETEGQVKSPLEFYLLIPRLHQSAYKDKQNLAITHRRV